MILGVFLSHLIISAKAPLNVSFEHQLIFFNYTISGSGAKLRVYNPNYLYLQSSVALSLKIQPNRFDFLVFQLTDDGDVRMTMSKNCPRCIIHGLTMTDGGEVVALIYDLGLETSQVKEHCKMNYRFFLIILSLAFVESHLLPLLNNDLALAQVI